jgi:hypothetical protein
VFSHDGLEDMRVEVSSVSWEAAQGPYPRACSLLLKFKLTLSSNVKYLSFYRI